MTTHENSARDTYRDGNEASARADVADRAPTGLADHVYDVVLLLQQAAEDVVRYSAFAVDARAASDEELAAWCEELADADREIVARAQRMLRDRLAG